MWLPLRTSQTSQSLVRRKISGRAHCKAENPNRLAIDSQSPMITLAQTLNFSMCLESKHMYPMIDSKVLLGFKLEFRGGKGY